MEDKCPFCYGTGIDPIRSGFVKHECKSCGGTGHRPPRMPTDGARMKK